MTQANTFYHLTEGLQNNDGSVVKRVILFGNNAYLWSTENGYEFFVEQALTINEENYQEINKLLETYGTDRWTTDAINSLERSKNSTERSLGYLDIAKSARNRFSNRQNNRYGKTSDGTGVDGNPVANTESQKDGIATFTTPKGEIYGFVDKAGNIYLDETVISPEHPIHEYTHLWDRPVRRKRVS